MHSEDFYQQYYSNNNSVSGCPAKQLNILSVGPVDVLAKIKQQQENL